VSKKLTANSVKKLVLESINFVKETRDELNLPLFSRLEDTERRLEKNGVFKAEKFRPHHLSKGVYAKAYGYFKAPLTIVLDEDLPLEGSLFNQSELAKTATYYCSVHEVIHADDYNNSNRIIKDTLRHIRREHKNELTEASQILSKHSSGKWEHSRKEMINIWTYQYVDSATHYRTYVVLKHKKFPKIDNIWVSLYNSIFSPRLFTTIESAKGVQYTSELLSKLIGNTCIIEVVKEYEEISQQKVRRYTV
jgi:hypothetical protein